jgi:hypothetical protein
MAVDPGCRRIKTARAACLNDYRKMRFNAQDIQMLLSEVRKLGENDENQSPYVRRSN